MEQDGVCVSVNVCGGMLFDSSKTKEETKY